MMDIFGKVIDDALIKDYTTYKLAGKINKVVYPKDIASLIELIKYLKKENIKYMVIGNGSNLIFTKDYDGVIIKLDNFNEIEINDNIITVGAGYNLIKLAMKTAKLGLSGLEFASGIPATIGGAIYMNAGAYKREMADVVSEVLIIDDKLVLKKLMKKDLKFSYRSSIFKEKNYICISAILKLSHGNKKEILDVINKRKKRRLDTQPLDYPSAGSVFRNPLDDYAGRLIEDAGLKGFSIGDAFVSKKHANFIINKGTAKGEDVKKLIMFVKKEIKEKYDIELLVEQEIIE